MIELTILFLAEKFKRYTAIFKFAFFPRMKNLHTIKTKLEVILIGYFGKWQSIKKVGGRRFVEGLYQGLFSFALPARMLFTKRNENRAWSQVSPAKITVKKNILVITNTIHKRKRKIYLHITDKCQNVISDEWQQTNKDRIYVFSS